VTYKKSCHLCPNVLFQNMRRRKKSEGDPANPGLCEKWALKHRQ